MATGLNPSFQTTDDDEGYTMTSDIVPNMTSDVTVGVDTHTSQSKHNHVYLNDVSRGKDDHVYTNEPGGKIPKKTGSSEADNFRQRNRRCDILVLVGVLAGLAVALVMAVMTVSKVTSLDADITELKSKLNDQVGY